MSIGPIVYFLFAIGIEPAQIIRLDTGRSSLGTPPHMHLRVAGDRSILYAEKHYLWHWDASGRMLGRIGAPEGKPGSVDYLGAYFWDGRHYWMVDGLKLSLSVYDKTGAFLSTDKFYCRQFLELEDQLFVSDHSESGSNLYAPLLKEINLDYGGGRAKLNYSGLSFCKASHRQVSFMNFNFKQVWLAKREDTYFVVDQLEPKIKVYDRATREAEKKVPLQTPFDPPFIPLQLTEYVLPPERFVNTGDTARWLHGWSRINGLHLTEKGFLVGYDTPDPQNPRASLQVVQEVTAEGRGTGRLAKVSGHLIGFLEDQAFIMTKAENGDSGFRVQIYEFK